MINNNLSVIKWLLDDDNPAVKYRTQTELLGMAKDSGETKQTRNALVSSYLLKSVMTLLDIGKDYSDSHALSALATQQSDGGYPCISNNPKISKPGVPHKSCFQMTTSYLLLAAEMSKKGLECPQAQGIINYFINRDVLYRHDDPTYVIKSEMGTTFHPPVCTRIGLHMILCSLSILGKGNDPGCKRAWELLDKKCGDDGKYVLDGSLTKPYIKIEKPGKTSKWVTFYALLAEKERERL